MMNNNNTSQFLVSVIIPVYNDTERLLRCLEALQHQTLPTSKYQIIIINNGDKNDLDNKILKNENIIIEYEPISGSYIARNKGINISRSKYIAFTDSDCIPNPNWLEKGLFHLQTSHKIGLVGGNIELYYKDPSHLSTAEVYEKHTAFQQQRYIEQYHFAATANMFTRSDVFNDIGLFNEELKSSGDKEWGERVYKAKYHLVYAGDVIVMHPARHSLKALYSKRKRVIGGTETLRNKRGMLSILDYDLLNGMIPPTQDVKHILKKPFSFYEKIIALSILISMSLYSTFIRLTLRLGGQASR